MAMKKTEKPLIYITRDIERALGIKPVGSYFIITNDTPYSQIIKSQYPHNVFLIKSETLLDTFDLLKAGEKIIEKITSEAGEKNKTSKKTDVDILVFKNTARIEEFCATKKWHLLNPAAALAEKIENKITQVKWLGSGKDGAEQFLPPHEIKKVSEIEIKSGKKNKVPAPFMLQWAHGHTGDGTLFIGADKNGEKTLAALREKFPEREARVTSYINGPILTANICVTDKNILVGNISTQITGILPFTDNPWSTIGNDWSLPHSILSEEKIAQFHEIAETAGKRMQKSGWLGLFGIDCIYDVERDNLHLIEINARQAASTTYESQLQDKIRNLAPEHFKNDSTIFEAHITALQNAGKANTNKTNKSKLIEINDGAQIIMRIPASAIAIKNLQKNEDEIRRVTTELRAKNYNVIEYTNTKPGDDIIRIQSELGIMESQNKFNARGKEILEIITGTKEITSL